SPVDSGLRGFLLSGRQPMPSMSSGRLTFPLKNSAVDPHLLDARRYRCHRYSIVQTEAILLTLEILLPSQIISKWVDCTIERTGRGVRSAQQWLSGWRTEWYLTPGLPACFSCAPATRAAV